MPNYKEMYFKLFRAHSEVLAILEQAGLKTEEMAMEDNEPILLIDIEEDAEDNE